MEIRPGLIAECIKGKRLSQNELYKLIYPYLMSICVRYNSNSSEADELLNEGFFKIIKYLRNYRSDEPFKPWIRKIMINTLIKNYNKNKLHKHNIVYIENYHDTEKYSELNSIIEKIDSEQIFEFINQLPHICKQVFNLFFIDGYKHKEIASMLGMSEGTSKWYLNSAREMLKGMITSLDKATTSVHEINKMKSDD